MGSIIAYIGGLILKKLIIYLITCISVIAGYQTCINAESNIHSEIKTYIDELLPNGDIAINVMDIGLPFKEMMRLRVLTIKMQKSLMEHLEWLNGYLEESKSGEPLPYHPNLGLTEEEYEEYLALSQDIKMFKKSEGKLGITRKDSKVILAGYKNIDFLNNIRNRFN